MIQQNKLDNCKNQMYLAIWNSINQINLENFESSKFSPITKSEQQNLKKFFDETSNYKVIKLQKLTQEDEIFLSRHNIKYEKILENQNIKQSSNKWRAWGQWISFQNLMVQNRCIYQTCPITGEEIKSQTSMLFGGFQGVVYRFISNYVFYLITGKNEFQKVYIYIPAIELILELCPNPFNPGDLVNSLKCFTVTNWKTMICHIQYNDGREIANMLGFVENIGHHIWNELSAIQRLHDYGLLEQIDKFIVGNNEYYAKIEDIFPEIPKEKITRVSRQDQYNEANEIILSNKYLAMKLGDCFIKEELAQRIYLASIKQCTASFLSEVEKAREKYFPLLWITVRVGNRTWIDFIEGIANIVRSLAQEFPDLGIVFDGVSRIDRRGKINHREEEIIKQENKVVQEIQSLLPPKIKIYNTIGSMMYESIVWAHAIDLYLAHWGGPLAKILLNANKPGVIHTNKFIYKTPLEKRAGSWERENVIVPVYVPENHIVDILQGVQKKGPSDKRPTINNYNCDWQVIHEEVLKLALSIKV